MRFKISFLFEALMAEITSELGWFVALISDVHAHCTFVFILSVAGFAVVEARVLEEFFGDNWKNTCFNKGGNGMFSIRHKNARCHVIYV